MNTEPMELCVTELTASSVRNPSFFLAEPEPVRAAYSSLHHRRSSPPADPVPGSEADAHVHPKKTHWPETSVLQTALRRQTA